MSSKQRFLLIDEIVAGACSKDKANESPKLVGVGSIPTTRANKEKVFKMSTSMRVSGWIICVLNLLVGIFMAYCGNYISIVSLSIALVMFRILIKN